MRILIALLFSISSFLHSQEVIKSFESHVTINKDASLIVHEKIVIEIPRSLQRRGLIRDFPTRYTDTLGNIYTVGFEVKKVQKNGVEEPYFIKAARNGVRIFIGDADIYLKGGIYTYEITYNANRLLGFFNDHDELYWNVTGNGWPFTIEHASATIRLPELISPENIKLAAYTGYQGERGNSYKIVSKDSQRITIEATTPLAPKQGFTIVIGWPKGMIDQPRITQKAYDFIADNISLIIVLCGFILLSLFSFWHYLRVKNSYKSVIIPLFYPPKDFSPGAVRYFIKFGYDAKVLASDIINMAVHGLITIDSEKKFIGRKYTIKKVKDVSEKSELFYYYDELLNLLFGKNTVTKIIAKKKGLELSSANRTILNDAIAYIDSYFKRTIQSRYFNFNADYVASAIAIASFAIIPSYFLLPWQGATYLYMFLVIAIIALIVFCYYATRGYTKAGNKIADEIAGFKMFLSATEKERMNYIGTPPERTPELYEKYLPYAVALGVEKQWSHQFAPLFAKMAEGGHPYEPFWYSGLGFGDMTSDNFASGLSDSLNYSISSSSNVPGGQSGFGDSDSSGGSSGGGGGGGGGGTW